MLRASHAARVLSITSLKGGVGKSPITVDVAACLVERGSRVALISHDCCYWTCPYQTGHQLPVKLMLLPSA
ncbi:ParA family protein [Pseudomonas typographi]|nr:P-loop NTPase [Pseudomonas typographi]